MRFSERGSDAVAGLPLFCGRGPKLSACVGRPLDATVGFIAYALKIAGKLRFDHGAVVGHLGRVAWKPLCKFSAGRAGAIAAKVRDSF